MSEVIRLCSSFIPVLPLLAGLFLFTKLSKGALSFLGYILVGFLVDIISLSDFIKGNTLVNIYGLFEVCFWLAFLTSRIQPLNTRRNKIFFLILMVIFFVVYQLAIGNYLLKKLPPLFHSVSWLIVSFYAAIALVIMVLSKDDVVRNNLFWFTAGIFFYTFSTTFFFTFISEVELREKIWWVHNLLNIITQLIYCFAILSEFVIFKNQRQPQKA